MVFPPSSPEVTKSSILGASSAGWSPQRSTRRVMNSSSEEQAQSPSDYGDSEHGSPSRIAVPEHRAKLGALRSHGLVSNSVFKGSSNNPSPSSSPSRRQFGSPSSPSRMGLGLGISAAAAAAAATHAAAMPRSTSATSVDSYGSSSDAENEDQSSRFSSQNGSPRKSTNFRRLEKANYVSNSPFRRTDNGAEHSPQRFETTPPLQLPNNAWAKSAAAAHSQRSPVSATTARPRTPDATPQRTATAIEQGQVEMCTPTHNSTPRGGLRKAANNAGVDSPSSVRGLLVSNRLHGPRLMDDSVIGTGSVNSSPHDSPTKRERRKTVTFDEILDVQEFDRESSYDRDSLQSGSSEASSLNGAAGNAVGGGGGLGSREASSDDEAMWLQSRHDEDARMLLGAQKVVERLMVVNGSPESHSSAFSTPELMGNGPNRANARVQERTQRDEYDDANLGAYDASSNDSREVSSVDEPQSPLPEELSMSLHDEKSFASNGEATIYHDGTYIGEAESDVSGGNLSAYGALHRVESMVDELLEDELLEGRAGEQRQQQQQQQQQPHRQDDRQPVMDSPPRRRGVRGPGTAATAAAAADAARPVLMQSPGPAQPTDLMLDLPAWSPFMQTAQSPMVNNATTATAAAQSRPNGRPHISRDAVLQRVAREKQLMEEQQQQQQQQSNVAQQADRSEIMQRVQPPGTASMGGAPRRSSPEHMRSPVRAANAEQVTAAQGLAATASPSRAQRSPLDRLSAQVTAEQQRRRGATLDEESSASVDSAAKRQLGWFGGESSRVGSTESEAAALPASTGGLTPAQQAEQIIARRRSKNGRTHVVTPTMQPAKSEAASLVGESSEAVEQSQAPHPPPERQSLLLDATTLKVSATEQDGFESGLQRELSRIYRHADAKYNVKDRGAFTHDENASSPGKEAQTEAAEATGDGGQKANAGKAWRKLRRPSDMNEYAQEMREYRAKENPKRVAGKVFVLVDSFTPTQLPVPAATRPTRFYCVLDNGLHVVRTATAGLRTTGVSKIGQEFELVQHRNLAFSLTLVAQRDAHLREPKYDPSSSPQQHGSPSGSSALSSSPSKRITPSFSRGVGKLFSSPKKRGAGGLFGSSGTSTSSLSNEGAAALVEPMVAFMNNEGAFGQCQVVFDKIANASLLQCHTIDMPMYGVKDATAAAATSTSTLTSTASPATPQQRSPTSSAAFSRNLNTLRGTLRLKVFYLPPLPGVAKTLLPDSLSECIKGMEAARWHAKQQQQTPWMQGTLTQLGGDCQSWRRRPVRAQGVHLIGYNEITKKPVVKIDLSKAVSVEPNHDPVKKAGSDARITHDDDDDEAADETYHVERSFRITFKDGERIFYFADSDEEMHSWIAALAKVIGNAQMPPQCVWAQMALDVVGKPTTASGGAATALTNGGKATEATATADVKTSHSAQRAATTQRVAVPTLVEE